VHQVGFHYIDFKGTYYLRQVASQYLTKSGNFHKLQVHTI